MGNNEHEKIVVEYGSIVKVKLTYDSGVSETIVTRMSADNDATIGYCTANSPLSKCILGKPVGFKGDYEANFQKINAYILGIV